MHIRIITPAPAGSRKGNRITAIRWARLLRGLGHRVSVAQAYRDEPCHLLVALHARRSAPSILRFRRARPDAPLVVALTGTDLYGDIHRNGLARQILDLADRLVVLQPRGLDELPPRLQPRTRVIHQSVPRPGRLARGAGQSSRWFPVCVLGHLRPVKDPFRAALAARRLPPTSRIRIVQIGASLSQAMAIRARREERRNPRYRWLGELPRWAALARLARSRLLVLSSKMEGGANVISEAAVLGVPVLASRIPGSIGLLGPDHPGLFPVGDTEALARLLDRAEREPEFLAELARRSQDLAPLFHPAREEERWKMLIEECSP